MGKPVFNRIHWPSIGAVLGAGILLVAFQNCGKAGMDGEDMSSLLSETPEQKKFKAAPFPFDVSINQVAYMTCPATRDASPSAEDVDTPFFTVRVGAFDNTSLAARYTAFGARSVDPEKSARLKAGVGLSKAFTDYIKKEFAPRLANAKPEDEKRLIRDAVMNSNHKFGVTGAMVFRNRRSPVGYSLDPQHPAKPSLPELTSLNVANQLVETRDLGIYGREKISYVTGVDLQNRTMNMSTNYPLSYTDIDNLQAKWNALEFVVGYAKPEMADDSFFLESPENENRDSVYGKVYRFKPLGSTWQGRMDRVIEGGNLVAKTNIQSMRPEFLTGVDEYEVLKKGAETPISAQEGHEWSCFSLMIVRNADRRDPVSGKLFDPGDYEDGTAGRNCKLWSTVDGTTCVNKLKFYDYQETSTSAIVPSAKVACPNQQVGDAGRFGSLNYNADGGVNRMRLEIARRFLPAEYWDINTHPEYMCAVPREAATLAGSCYGKNSDNNPKDYILYSQTGTELGQPVTCGVDPLTNKVNKRCPAFVSICYRTH